MDLRFAWVLFVPFFLTGAGSAQVFSPSLPISSDYATNIGYEGDCKIATDGNGNWVVAWRRSEPTADPGISRAKVLIVRSTNAGQTWSPPMTIWNSTISTGDREDSLDLAAAGIGKFICVFDSRSATYDTCDEDDAFYSRSLDGGISWSTPVPLNASPTVDCFEDSEPSIASDGNSMWMASWIEWSTDDVLSDVRYTRSFDGGATWSTPAYLHGNLQTLYNEDIRIAADGNGNWVICWISGNPYNPCCFIDINSKVMSVRSSNNGQNWTTPQAIYSGATAGHDVNIFYGIDLATDTLGSWVLAIGDSDGQNTYLPSRIRSVDNGYTWTSPIGLPNGIRVDSLTIAPDRTAMLAGENALNVVGDDFIFGAHLSSNPYQYWGSLLAGDISDEEADSVQSATDDGDNWVLVYRYPDTFQAESVIYFTRLVPDTTNMWVKFGYTGPEDGTQGKPYNTLGEGVSAVASGGTVHITPGASNFSSEKPRVSKPVTLVAPSGAVAIGLN